MHRYNTQEGFGPAKSALHDINPRFCLILPQHGMPVLARQLHWLRSPHLQDVTWLRSTRPHTQDIISTTRKLTDKPRVSQHNHATYHQGQMVEELHTALGCMTTRSLWAQDSRIHTHVSLGLGPSNRIDSKDNMGALCVLGRNASRRPKLIMRQLCRVWHGGPRTSWWFSASGLSSQIWSETRAYSLCSMVSIRLSLSAGCSRWMKMHCRSSSSPTCRSSNFNIRRYVRACLLRSGVPRDGPLEGQSMWDFASSTLGSAKLSLFYFISQLWKMHPVICRNPLNML